VPRMGAGAVAVHRAKRHRAHGRPVDLARSWLAAGSALRRSGERRRAGEKIDTASEIFERLGAKLWHERCTDELRSAWPRPRRDRELTAAEGARRTPRRRWKNEQGGRGRAVHDRGHRRGTSHPDLQDGWCPLPQRADQARRRGRVDRGLLARYAQHKKSAGTGRVNSQASRPRMAAPAQRTLARFEPPWQPTRPRPRKLSRRAARHRIRGHRRRNGCPPVPCCVPSRRCCLGPSKARGAAAGSAGSVPPAWARPGDPFPVPGSGHQSHAKKKKTALWRGFREPSAGLEPATPSLPWKCSTN
jgi:hypothetical protein